MLPDGDRPRSELRLGAQLGSGGQGEVWQVANHPGYVFKRYFDPGAVDAVALAALVDLPRRLPPEQAADLNRQAAWPLARVLDGGRPVGFLMREVPADFIGRTAAGPQLRELQYLIYPRKAMWGDIVPLDTDGRVEVVQTFARLVWLMHGHDVVIGDISMRNLLWKPGLTAAIYLIDCDGAYERSTPAVLPLSETPDWNDPLLTRPPNDARWDRHSLDLDTDRYKLALVAGRVLSGEPSVRPGDQLQLPYDLSPAIAAAVRRCFEDAAGPRHTRPKADRWVQAARGRSLLPVAPPAGPRPRGPSLPKAQVDQRTKQRQNLPIQRPGPN